MAGLARAHPGSTLDAVLAAVKARPDLLIDELSEVLLGITDFAEFRDSVEAYGRGQGVGLELVGMVVEQD